MITYGTAKYPTSNRELKRYLLSKNIWANTVKWLGRYDIAMNGRLYPTGLRSIQDLTFNEWELLIRRVSVMPDDLYQIVNGNISTNYPTIEGQIGS